MSRDENWFYSIAAILLLLFVPAFVFNESWTHQRRVNIFYVQEAVVYTMNLLMLHATLRNTGSKYKRTEVELSDYRGQNVLCSYKIEFKLPPE